MDAASDHPRSVLYLCRQTLHLRFAVLFVLVASIAALWVAPNAASAQVQDAPIPVPGTIQAEAFIDYVDSDPENQGNAGIRTDESVDIWTTVGEPAGYTVGRTRGGESLSWDVSVAAPATMRFAPRVATGFSTPGTITLSVDDTVVLDAAAPQITGWWSFQSLASTPITLAAGTHRVTVEFGGAGQINFDRIDVTAATQFACESDAGEITWTSTGSSVYWVYRSTDGGDTFSWIGRWKSTDAAPNPEMFIDGFPVVGATYQVRQPSQAPGLCSTASEPGQSQALVCDDGGSGSLSWTDLDAERYWIYRSDDGGASWYFIGRSFTTTYSDATPNAGARYVVHFAGYPRTPCNEEVDPASTLYVEAGAAPGGDGSADQPFAKVADGLLAVAAGETLIVGGGEYVENISVGWSGQLAAGTAENPIIVRAATNERPVIKGILRLHNMAHWDVSGINVTWNDANPPNEHMVKLNGGNDWTFRDAEVWGAKSYAGVLVSAHTQTGAPSNWTLRGLYVHDTVPANDVNQDHLLYINAGAGGGLIEGNLLVGSPNGRAIKLGTTNDEQPSIGDVTVRYNTMVDNTGPSNVQLSYRTSDITIERNLLVSPKQGYENITTYRLSGSNSIARNNLGWDSVGVVEEDPGLIDGGGNRGDINPGLDANYLPTNPAAAAYGHGALPNN